MATKVCGKCGEPKDTSLFSKDPKMKGGFRSWCKKCTSKAASDINKKRYVEDPTYRSRQLEASEIHQERYPYSGTWQQMNQRCLNPNHEAYKNYGGRGISVCKDWQDSYEKWYDYVSKLPHFSEEGYTQDRVNNDGNYEPDNIRWATSKEQLAN